MLIKTGQSKKTRYLAFNLNDNVRFKLTPEGFAIHRRNWDRLDLATGGSMGKSYPYQPPKVDSEGFTEDPMWCVMHEYGESLYNGCHPPFEPTIQIASDDLSPVKRAKGKVSI